MCDERLTRRDQGAHAGIAEIQPSPQQDGNVDGEENEAEQRRLDAQLARKRAAEISREENRAEYRCPWNEIQRETHELDDAERRSHSCRIAEMFHGVHHLRRV